MTISGLERALPRSLARDPRSVGGWRVRDLGFNRWLLELLNPSSPVYGDPPDVLAVVLSPRLLQQYPDPGEKVAGCLQALERHRAVTEVLFTTAAADPLLAAQLPGGAALQRAAHDVNCILLEQQRAHAWFHVLDMHAFMARYGLDELHDPRYEAMARMYLSPRGIERLADLLARHVAALAAPPKKVLVVDLDNTLWGGVLGEDGLEGIAIGGENVGHSFLAVQRMLVAWQASGVLLAICSKNDEDDALRALETHPDMLLRPAAFACRRINWRAKAENLREIALELNLGLDSFVFLDDSPFERQQIREFLPEVDVIDLPDDPALYPGTLADYRGFDTLRVTQEDRARADLYAAEARRKALQRSAVSLDEFYRDLEMRAQIAPGTAHLDRVFQLVHKTNQFNLTSRRYSEQELQQLTAGPASAVYVLRLSDKLGESGLTGVVVVRMHPEVWEIDNLLLSCRIIGRTVEYALIRWLAARAAAHGARLLLAEFVPTARNGVAAGFLASAGFLQDPASGTWGLDLAGWELRVPRDYVTVVESEAPWVSTDGSSKR